MGEDWAERIPELFAKTGGGMPMRRDLYRRLEFVAKVLRKDAEPDASPRRLAWYDQKGELCVARVGDPICAIGRGKECDVVVEHPRVSRRHCAIHRAGGRWAIVDTGSLHGTSVNGRPIRGASPTLLRDGDVVELAGCVMQLFLEAPLPARTGVSA